MKTSLTHLPENKQKEINFLTSIIKELVNPEMIIRFGSHAEGTYVGDRYFSKGITCKPTIDSVRLMKQESRQ